MPFIKYNKDEQDNKKIIIKIDPETDETKVSCGCCDCQSCGTIAERLGDQAPSALAISATTPFTLYVGGPPTPPANGGGSTDACFTGATNCESDDPWLCYEQGIDVFFYVTLGSLKPLQGTCGLYIDASMMGNCGAFGFCIGSGTIGPIPKESIIGVHTVPIDFNFSFTDPDTGETNSFTVPTSATVTIS